MLCVNVQSVDRGMMGARQEATHTIIKVTPATPTLKTDVKGEAALDALLNELQTFSKPSPPSSQKKPG